MRKNRTNSPQLLFLILCLSFILSGCKQIFVQNVDPYEQVRLSKEELQTNIFYVKDGTKFIQLWKPDSFNTGYETYLGIQNNHVLCLRDDYRAVPTLYKDELLVIASTNTGVGDFKLTRYKELGYSIGCYGLTFDSDGYLVGSLPDNIYPNSNLYAFLKQNAKSEKYRLISINAEDVSPQMISSHSGSFNCMEKDKSYQIEYYAGTYYSSMEIAADTLVLEQYEYFSLEGGQDTKNGYVSFAMPAGAKSGWYQIDGYGLFRYIAQEKGADLEGVDMNTPFFESDQERISMYSQKFSTTLDTRKTDITLAFTYVANDITDTEVIQGRAYAPDGTEYLLKLDAENNRLLCELKEAMAGKWEIYIQPKEITISSMDILNSSATQEITEEEYPLIIETDQTNVLITVTYEGEGEIYSILVTPDQKRYDFVTDSSEKTMTYLAPYLQKGIYTVKVYHYTNTNVLDMETQEDTKTSSDIITITE